MNDIESYRKRRARDLVLAHAAQRLDVLIGQCRAAEYDLVWRDLADAIAAAELQQERTGQDLPREHIVALVLESFGCSDNLINFSKRILRQCAQAARGN